MLYEVITRTRAYTTIYTKSTRRGRTSMLKPRALGRGPPFRDGGSLFPSMSTSMLRPSASWSSPNMYRPMPTQGEEPEGRILWAEAPMPEGSMPEGSMFLRAEARRFDVFKGLGPKVRWKGVKVFIEGRTSAHRPPSPRAVITSYSIHYTKLYEISNGSIT